MKPKQGATSVGSVMGWSVFPSYTRDRWQWTAMGPRGSECGSETSEAAAKAIAHQAYERLRKPNLRSVD